MRDRKTLPEQLRALAVLASVAELGSFRGAARALAVSPSVVSHHVSELERRLGVPLVYRSTRRLALTAEGVQLAAAARQMVEAAARGLDELSGRAAEPAGALRLTVPAFVAETGLCRDLAEFALTHPHIALTMSFSEEPRDLLRDGFDVALRIGRLKDSSQKVRKLAEMRRVLVGAPAYVQARRAPRAPRELANWDFIRLSPRPAEVTLHHGGRLRPVSLELPPRIEVDSAAAVRGLTLAGAGISTLPELMVRGDLARGALTEVLPGWFPAPVGVYAVWPAGAQRATLTTRLVEFLSRCVPALFSPR